MSAYYNEHDPQKAAWLRELIARNLIAPGDVDERSIEIVQPEEVRGYTQCHFFAGIGVWSYALRNAGWPDDAPVWTGSCPCQGFSASGKRGGFSDKRHLWPAWYRILSECRPDVVFGEQVASPDGVAWLDVVSADMEGAGYAIGAADLCAAGVGAPHIRQRLFFVGYSERARLEGYAWPSHGSERRSRPTRSTVASGAADRLADTNNDEQRFGRDARSEAGTRRQPGVDTGGRSVAGTVAHAGGAGVREDAGPVRREGADVAGDGQRLRDGAYAGGATSSVADTSSVGHREHERNAGAVGATRNGNEGEEPEPRGAAQTTRNRSKTCGVADTAGGGFGQVPVGSAPAETTREGERGLVPGAGSVVGHAAIGRERARDRESGGRARPSEPVGESGLPDVVGDSESGGWGERGDEARAGSGGHADRAVLTGFWADAEWIPCTDGKARPIEPGSSPLAHGAPFRVVRLRGYGDGIVGPLAEEFVQASCEVLEIGEG